MGPVRQTGLYAWALQLTFGRHKNNGRTHIQSNLFCFNADNGDQRTITKVQSQHATRLSKN